MPTFLPVVAFKFLPLLFGFGKGIRGAVQVTAQVAQCTIF
jgi:hypothetical protein